MTKAFDTSHITPSHLKILFGIDLSTYNLYMIARNPYDSELSYYYYMKKSPHHRYHKQLVDKSFREYLEWRVENAGVSQQDYYCENIKVFQLEQIHLFHDHFKFKEVRMRNSTGPRKVKVYDERCANIVYKMRRRDFDTFKYSKDSWSQY